MIEQEIKKAERFLYGLLAVLMIACTKDANLVVTTPPLIDTTAVVKYSGTFSNGPYGTVMGNVDVVKQDSLYALRIKSFSTSSGPDLHVYLSKEKQPQNFIDLGSLRAITGNQDYSIPPMTDFAQYKYALIHCKAYNHLFGVSLLH